MQAHPYCAISIYDMYVQLRTLVFKNLMTLNNKIKTKFKVYGLK